jgi:oligoribonuclease NrnB/cAMP/cGMP phosphodiesterase (DHH superfamily)
VPGKAVVVTHTDLDGVAAAAIYHRIVGLVPDQDTVVVMTEPYRLHRSLSSLGEAERVAIMDLGPNQSTFEKVLEALRALREHGARLEWYDHHRWEEAWARRLREVGVEVFLDTSTCAAGVVAKYASALYGVDVDEHVSRLVSATCAADLWRWDDPLAPKLYRVVDRYKGARGDAWKRKLIRGFYEGSLWWPDLDDALNEYLRLEFRGFEKALRNTLLREAAGCRFALVLKDPGPPNASILGNALIDRLGVDFVAIIRKRGRGMSLRSRRVNVREIAYRLGGGGHPRAAGAPLQLPLHYRLVSLLYPRIRLRYAARLLEKTLGEMGGCPE